MSEVWQNDALCNGKNLDFWYPPLESDEPGKFYAIAREVCHICPVWEACLEDGKKEIWGMWGGLTPLERSVFKPHPKKTATRIHGTASRYRQGCRCPVCSSVHTAVLKEVKDISIIPGCDVRSSTLDLFEMLYKLLQ